MDTTDICEMDEFKNDPECKKSKKCGILEDIFWATVLITIAFFTRTWYMIADRFLTSVLGVHKSNTELAVMGGITLIIVLILSQYFDVNIKMD
jgi:uncharacterized protein YqhQ